MANIEKWGPNWLQVVLDGSGDWTCSQTQRFKAMYFGPSAASDKIVVAEVVPTESSSANYPRKYLLSSDGEPRAGLLHFSSPAKIMIPIAECTFTTVGNVVVTFDYQ